MRIPPEHTAFNCYQPKAENPHVLNISCPSPSPDHRSLPIKGQDSKIKIVQGVYGISKYPGKIGYGSEFLKPRLQTFADSYLSRPVTPSVFSGIRCYFKYKDCYIDDIGGLKDCSGKVSCQVKVDRRFVLDEIWLNFCLFCLFDVQLFFLSLLAVIWVTNAAPTPFPITSWSPINAFLPPPFTTFAKAHSTFQTTTVLLYPPDIPVPTTKVFHLRF